jgi:cytidine deaminase
MTILEELIDAALNTCENQRHANRNDHARAAVVLGSSGKMYVGCDMMIPGEPLPVAAEKSALLTAVADGCTSFEV